METKDYIVRGIAANGGIRCFAITSRNIVEEARRRHNTSPVITAALGRLLSGGAMMGAMMKNPSDLLTLQIQCNGPVKGLTVTADASGHVKGYANVPQVHIGARPDGKLNVGGALDLGVLTVIKDIGLKEPYAGQVQLVSGEIAEDLTYYFATSEQTPSSVALGVLMNKNNTVNCAGGYIIQLMPDVEDEVIDRLETVLKETESVTTLLSKGYTPETMLHKMLDEFGLELGEEKMPASFSCNCSKERMEKALVSLGSREIQNIIDDGEKIEMKCHFCNSSYEFEVEELQNLLNDLKA